MTEISGFALDSSPKPANYLLEVDPADHTMASTGTDKRATISSVGKVVTSGWQDLVRDFGADPTGGTSIATPFASACSAAVSAQPATVGLTVPPGVFRVTQHQDLPWNLVMRCAGSQGGDVTNQFTGTVFKVDSSFSGSYVLGFLNNADHTSANGAQVTDLMINGQSQTASAVAGMMISGPTNVLLRNVGISQMSGWAVGTGVDSSASEQFPYGQTWYNVTADSCGVVSGGGFQLNGCEDSVFVNVYSIGNGSGPGFYISGCDNTKFVGCNAEWNATHGFYVTGDWQWFTGQCQFVGCSTDANTNYGYYQDATWTTGGGAGTGPCTMVLSGCAFRRDGQGTAPGSGVYAGIGIGATTLPIICTGFGIMPSIGDGGGGTMSPNYGIYFTQSTYSQPMLFANGLAWGYTTGIFHGNGGGGSAASGFPTGVTNNGILLAHGNNYAPTYGSLQGRGRLTVPPRVRALPRAEHVVGPVPLQAGGPRVVVHLVGAEGAFARGCLRLLVRGGDGGQDRGGLDRRGKRRHPRRGRADRHPLVREAEPRRRQGDEDEHERGDAEPELERVAVDDLIDLVPAPGEQQQGGDCPDGERHQAASLDPQKRAAALLVLTPGGDRDGLLALTGKCLYVAGVLVALGGLGRADGRHEFAPAVDVGDGALH